MKEIAEINKPIFNKFYNRDIILHLTQKELQVVAAHCTQDEFVEQYTKYISHVFSGSPFSKILLDTAINNYRHFFITEELIEQEKTEDNIQEEKGIDDTGTKNKGKSKGTSKKI